jgi:hypothetical protein
MSGNVGAGQIITFPSSSSLQPIYANQLRVSVTVSDITIIFGALEDRANNLINEDKSSVHLFICLRSQQSCCLKILT